MPIPKQGVLEVEANSKIEYKGYFKAVLPPGQEGLYRVRLIIKSMANGVSD